MISFLRKIRKSLIDSGATSKYLLYAIGEIALVVIGILIALQINNWNEAKKSKTRLLSHYHELKDELSFDLIRIDQHLLDLKNIDDQGMYMRSFLQEKLEIVDSLKLAKAFLEAGYYVAFDASRVAYDNLVSSGEINLIENNELKRQLSEFHNPGGWDKRVDAGYVRQSLEAYHHYRHYFTEPLMDRTFHHNSLLAENLPEDFDRLDQRIEDFKIDWRSLRNDNEYSVKLDQVHTARINQKLLYYRMRQFIKEMIQMIEAEIKDRD